jgi:uncharacterized protein YfaS (alpha-2-macroglobulin family)
LWVLLSPSAFSYLQLEVTVHTDKPSYSLGESVKIFGQVTLNSAPVASAMVALEIRDPLSSPIMTRTVETNSSGLYDVVFTLGSENPLGTYTVHVSCSHDGEKASNSSSFDVKHVPSLALTVKTSSGSYKPGETIIVFGNLTYDNSPIKGMLVAVEVQDPESTPIVIRVLETNEQGGYQLTLQLTYKSKTGEYKTYASATYKETKVIAYTTFKLQIELSADINKDGKVDIVDLFLVARAWGTKPGGPNWDPRCDIDGNGEINIKDIFLVARDFGKKVS